MGYCRHCTKNVSNVVGKPNVIIQKSTKGYALKMIKVIRGYRVIFAQQAYIKVTIIVESTLFKFNRMKISHRTRKILQFEFFSLHFI